MKIILSEQVKSLTGTLGAGFGYYIQRRKSGFYGVRNSKGIVPPDGHWKFIVHCAELATMGLHIANICVSEREMWSAIREANIQGVGPVGTYNAKRVLDLCKFAMHYEKRQ